MALHPPRALTILCAGVLASSLVAGCSKGSDESQQSTSPAPAPQSSTATAAPSPTTPPVFGALPSDMSPVLEALYAGGQVPASASAAPALAKRTAVELPAGTKVTAAQGMWKKEPLAVVKAANDVTLLVKGKTGWQVVGGWWPSLKVTGPVLGGKQFRVLLGVDTRPGEPLSKTNADAIHVLGYDGKKAGGLMGMTRDTYVTLPSGYKDKINQAFKEGGAPVMVRAIANQTGLPLTQYMYVNFDGFKKMVDDMGGLDITLPYAIDTETSGVLPAGKNHLNGKVALALARERHTLPDGDFSRSRHQNLILLAGGFAAKAKGPVGLAPMMTTIGDVMVTNMTAEQALTMFAMPYAIDVSKVGQGVSKGSFGWAPNGASIVIPGAAEEALYADFQDGNLTP